MPDGIAVQAFRRPDTLLHNPILLHQSGVQTIRLRSLIPDILLLHPSVKILCFRLGHTLVEMTGRCRYQILTVGLVDTLGKDTLIKDNRKQLITELLQGLTLPQWQTAHIHLMKHTCKILTAESWLKFLTSIVVVDTIREPDAFQIDLQRLELIGVVIHGEVGIDHFQHLTDAKIVFAVLVEGDVPAKKSRLGEIID